MNGAIGIHHLGIAVSDLEAAAQQYALLIGATIDHGHDSEELGTRALAIRTPAGPMIELVAPYADDTPVGRFIAKRGEGMHHVAYEVADIDAECARLLAAGVEMIDEAPRAGLFGLQVAFIHPDAVRGVLLEIVHREETSMADNVRVEIGFVGGGTTSTMLSDAAWKKLLKAVEKSEEGVLELASETGDLFVRSNQVAFIRVLSKEARVGF